VDAWELRTQGRVIVAEVALAGLAEGALSPERAKSVGRFPEVERDLAVVADERVGAVAIEDVIRRHGGPLLLDVRLFDIYRGTPLEADAKSLAFRVRFGADRTLTEAEVEAAISDAVTAIGAAGWRLRA
jgi:phenylalanyl-tRNA synthetase beta chain